MMHNYSIQKIELIDPDGEHSDGWEVVSNSTVVATIFDSDFAELLKRLLLEP